MPPELTIELKNGISIVGTLAQVDEQMNFHLTGAKMLNSECFDCCGGGSLFIRGNVIRYVHMSKAEVDVEPLTQACLKQKK